MKRHMKLIFKILEYVERSNGNGDSIPSPEFDDYSRREVEYHVQLCSEAGYLTVKKSYGPQAELLIFRMTWAGHEELGRMRREGCVSTGKEND